MFCFPNKMLQVFQDEKHQAEFEQNGFIILSFYNENEIEELKSLYYKLHPKDEKGFFPSTFSKDKNYRNEADKEIKRICNRSISHYCKDIKVVCGSFIVKSSGVDSGMCVHQDMSLVDESIYTGINIWVPLVDLSIENGALFVLPKSHRIFPTYRGSSIPEFFAPVMNEMVDYLKPVLIKAGEAVFFDQSIIHFSPPNFSNNIRIVTNTYIAHIDTKYRTYYWNKDEHINAVEAFAQEDDFMTNFDQFGDNIRDRPKVGDSLGLVPYNFPTINLSFLENNFTKTNARTLIEQAQPKIYQSINNVIVKKTKHNFFQRIKTWISQ